MGRICPRWALYCASIAIPRWATRKSTAYAVLFSVKSTFQVGEILPCNMKYAFGVWNSPDGEWSGFNFTWCVSIKFHDLRSKLFHRERQFYNETPAMISLKYISIQEFVFMCKLFKMFCKLKCGIYLVKYVWRQKKIWFYWSEGVKTPRFFPILCKIFWQSLARMVS